MTEIDRKSHQELASEVKQKSDETATTVESLKSKLSNTQDGLSCLDLKNLLMVDYMTNLTYLMLRKSFGKKIEGDPSIERLVENRTVLEKLRPIEKKLKYQIDKYIKVADSGTVPENDPMHFKPNLESLDRDSDDNSEDEEDDETTNVKGTKKYVAPKHVPAYFDHDDNPESAEKERAEKVKKRILSRGLIDDLKRQHLDTPEEVFDAETVKQSRQVAYERERTRFEEENFMRLPETKKDKKASRKSGPFGLTMGRLGDEITHDFGKSSFGEDFGEGGRKRKSKGSGKAKKKFKRRK